MIRLYNTLSRKLEPFSPVGNVVKMYVCGVTPYAASHVGHAMRAMVFDVLRRYLEFSGYEVKHVENFTDIDDKMIESAAKQGLTTQELAEKNIDTYIKEMDSLNVQQAHIYPRATQEIAKIQEMIKALQNKGFAYESQGNVYFRVLSKPDYGKLSHRTLEGMTAGARIEIDERKEDTMDFALWKSQKPNEPAWESPWGPGRPGWHIECSAMVLAYLGKTVDIHGGGQELIFPHHENEIAQSESFTDYKPFVRFWIHNGLVQFGKDKMSKSLGNFVTVQDALERFSPDTLRMFFLTSHYRSSPNYSVEHVTSQDRAVDRLRNSINLDINNTATLQMNPIEYRDRFISAMDDDLNTPRALAVLFDLAHEINRKSEKQDVSNAQSTLKELANVLGLTLEPREHSKMDDLSSLIELLLDTRATLRSTKQFSLADQIRDRLWSLGFVIEDTNYGTEWKNRS